MYSSAYALSGCAMQSEWRPFVSSGKDIIMSAPPVPQNVKQQTHTSTKTTKIRDGAAENEGTNFNILLMEQMELHGGVSV